jgi:hypothetical protein
MKCVHRLQPEAGHVVFHEVATDHAFRQARLPGLIHHVTTVLEIRRHQGNELIEARRDFGAAARSVLGEDPTGGTKRCVARLAPDAPDADATVSTPLLQDPDPAVGQTVAEIRPQLFERVDSVDIAAPAHLACVDEHVFRAQLHDHIGMRADEHAGVGDHA